MKIATLILPHQLFEQNPAIVPGTQVYLIEEFLFFSQYNFHLQKLKYHRATMRFYENYLRESGVTVVYIETNSELADVRKLIPNLIKNGVTEIHFCDVTDNWLEKRIKGFAEKVNLVEHETPMFLNSKSELQIYFKTKKHYFQTDFYTQQRKKRQILLEADLKPVGGKWTFDAENRSKYPKDKVAPTVEFPTENKFVKEAAEYVKANFGKNYGVLESKFVYPTTYTESREWLGQFLKTRFHEFGEYEDALVADEQILHHSLLTPMMNVGLLTPREIIDTTLEFAAENNVPLNSLEGFIRQIVGWREFIRGVYEVAGTRERTMNFWKC